MNLLPERLELLSYWVRERESIRQKKEAGLPKPWTQNVVLQTTRFCNCRRVDDKVSRWLLSNWYTKTAVTHPLAAAGLARLINWPDTLEVLLHDAWEWDMEAAMLALRLYRDDRNKVFTGVYIINGTGAKGRDKIFVVCRQVNTFYMHPELLDPKSMESTWRNLMRVPGIGTFIAGQMTADLRHVVPGEWADKMAWAPLGPGSQRGLSWLQGWDGLAKLPSMSQAVFTEGIGVLMPWFASTLPEIFDDRKLEAHDVQNCLCEYDKFMRISTGVGRGKNSYPGVCDVPHN